MARNTITSSGDFSLRTAKSGGGNKKRAVLLFFVLFLVLLQMTTQHIASQLFFHRSLGAFFSIGGAKIYPFYKCLFWIGALADVYMRTGGGEAARVLFSSAGMLCVGCLVSLFIAKIYHGRAATNSLYVLHGSAHWAMLDEIIQSGLLGHRGQANPEGVVVGGYSRNNGDDDIKILRHNGKEHIMVYAPTRSGKGVSLVLPTLLDGWRESAFVFDIKGENYAGSAGYRSKVLGHKIIKLDFTDPSAVDKATSATFNPLEEVKLDYVLADDYQKYDESGKLAGFGLIPSGTYVETAAIQQIVAVIIDPQGKGLDDHWQRTASSLMLGCITHLLYKAQLEHLPCPGIADVLSELTQTGKTSEQIITSWQTYPHLGGNWLPDPDGPGGNVFVPRVHQIVTEEAQSLLNKPDKERGSVISTAVANLALFRDPVVTRNTSRSSFRIRDLMKNDSAVDLYLIVNPNDQLRLLPLTRLFTTQLVFTLVERMEFKDGRTDEAAQYKHRLLLLLDEFPSLGRMDLFEKALGFISGYGIKAFIVCQGLAQLFKAYGKEEALRVACHIQIAFAPNDQETCEYLSKLTGQKTVIKENVTETRRSGSLFGRDRQVSLQEVQRPLLTPDECRRLPGLKKDAKGDVTEAGDMLIFPAGYSAIYGRQTLYFKNREMRDRAKILPPYTSDNLTSDIRGAELAYNVILRKFEALQEAYFQYEEAQKILEKANMAPKEYNALSEVKIKRGEASLALLPASDAVTKIVKDARRLKAEVEAIATVNSESLTAKVRKLSHSIETFLTRRNEAAG